jgi:hypothetical protein
MKNGSNLGNLFGVRMCLHLQLQFLSLSYRVFSYYETDCICDIIQKGSNKLLSAEYKWQARRLFDPHTLLKHWQVEAGFFYFILIYVFIYIALISEVHYWSPSLILPRKKVYCFFNLQSEQAWKSKHSILVCRMTKTQCSGWPKRHTR